MITTGFENMSENDMNDVLKMMGVSKKERYWGGEKFSLYTVRMESAKEINNQFHIGIGKRIFMFVIVRLKGEVKP